MVTLVPFRSIVPAFFIIDSPADAADEAASAACIDLNTQLREDAAPNRPRVRLYLCEASPTTEILVDKPLDEDPHTLAGYTCDSDPQAELIARYQAFGFGCGRVLGSASDEIHRDDWTAPQRQWLTDFIAEWEEKVDSAVRKPAPARDVRHGNVLVVGTAIHANAELHTRVIDAVRDAALCPYNANSEPDAVGAWLDSHVRVCAGLIAELATTELPPADLTPFAHSSDEDEDLARGQYDVHVTAAEPEPETEPTAVTLTFPVSDRLCADIMCAALEGGIGYWSEASKIVQTTTLPESDGSVMANIPDYVSCVLTPAEDEDEFEPQALDYPAIRRGIRRILTGEVGIRSDLRDAVHSGVTHDDGGAIDADAADCIVQAAVFGELRYG